MIKKTDRRSVLNGVIDMELKDRIIHSAYELFSTKGYEKTTIEAIIKQAQCAKGGFYHHFKSKEEILEVIISNYIDELSEHFENIVSNDKYSFFDKFNAIFMVISQYKLKQLKEWSKVNNVFSFIGNDRVLRQLEKQFKIATTRAYFEVLRNGKEQGIVNVEHPEILAELCTREVLWIFEAAGRLINPDDAKGHDTFEKLLDFSEGLISHALGLKKHEVEFKDIALSYLQEARGYYLASKEGL
ncbi:MAG: TetR/AcrR family transcriptional regulator [Bacillota bacterium]